MPKIVVNGKDLGGGGGKVGASPSSPSSPSIKKSGNVKDFKPIEKEVVEVKVLLFNILESNY